MLLLMNTFITHSMNPYHRGHLHRDDNFEILKYTISSLAAVNRWSYAIFRIRLDNHYAHRSNELGQYIQEEFGPVCPRIEYTNWRNEYQNQWVAEVERLEKEPDPYIWYSCNHDHVFMDYDHEALDTALVALDNEPQQRKAIYYSHWPEFNRVMQNNFPDAFRILPCGSAIGLSREMDSIQIVSKPLLRDWWFSRDFGSMYRPRSDWKDIHTCDPYPTIAPFREICKHYDGYSHLFDTKVVPPLTIPPGFFDRNIKICYGVAPPTPREEYVWICPMGKYKTEDPHGVDYRWVLEDIPLFWKDRITLTVRTNEETLPWMKETQDASYLYHRNQAVRDYMTAHTGHPHLGDKLPPEEYIQKRMR